MNSSTLKNLLQKLSSFGLETLELFKTKPRQDFSASIQSLCQSLLGLQGEAASVAIAEEIILSYQRATAEEKSGFFRYLHDKLAADPVATTAAIARYQAAPSQANLQALMAACEAPRLELLRTLNTAPGGTMALISMREDLLKIGSTAAVRDILDADFATLFRAWFN
ncbi:MAG: hypothetical protein RLZZ169_2104, partial [Pseudomonadota bacterium]